LSQSEVIEHAPDSLDNVSTPENQGSNNSNEKEEKKQYNSEKISAENGVSILDFEGVGRKLSKKPLRK
jgi:hypothetical protein